MEEEFGSISPARFAKGREMRTESDCAAIAHQIDEEIDEIINKWGAKGILIDGVIQVHFEELMVLFDKRKRGL